jgi:hypothetical protein
MAVSDRLCAAGILAVLGLLTSAIASVVVATRQTSALIVFGSVLLVFGVVKVLHSFWLKTDRKLRWSTFWTGVLCSFGGGVLFAETDDWRADSYSLTLIVFYSLTAIAVSVLLSNYYNRVTGCAFPAILANAQIGPGDERLFYFATNLFSGFFAGVAVAHSAARLDVAEFDAMGIIYAVPVWFINALLLAIFGWVIAKDRAEIKGKYNSTTIPIISDAAYTDGEPV